ncbi:hypothetical protein H7J87_20630 [Mycolicibacterium wolinskyi]|uniref:Lipoprotein LpqB beta-propeller domain-containing protein n=1 Tax=Mycolicibacterium wolinskyi TaxID=59750 RepID=A0A1X2F235_9MYCO|nr:MULTISPECIES: hypothetical protein [Mycolicibacterium]MCV7287737.1 hypothetical protein [Mycolicibacterium wolinskyi]MCV7294635.1 hypothetical protein [Mycolicibacterium goodii]ORX12493.1 hypothetical protein AWC31_31455 [Mycolicibacterium wolinskyi]
MTGTLRSGRLLASVVALVLAASGCQARGEPVGPATQSASPQIHGPLIAYTVPRTTPWWDSGEVSFVLAQGSTPVATWKTQVGPSRFVGMGAPGFTTDGKYAYAQYIDEQAGRYPYDGADMHARLVWIDVVSGQTHEVDIPAQSRTNSQRPSRPGTPYPLQGSTVVWQATSSSKAPDGQVTLMQLDLSQPDPAPSILRTVELPPRSPDQQTVPAEPGDFTGNVIGAGHGRVAIVKKYGDDRFTQADRLFLVDSDGTVRAVAHQPTRQWVSAIFSPDGTRLAFETGNTARPDICDQHQITVFDTATGRQAAGFPPGPFDATPRPYFYGNQSGAVWWTPDGQLRATASAELCPTNRSVSTRDGGVWELNGTSWKQIAPDGTYREYPLPHGDAVVITRAPRPPDDQQRNQSPSITSVFIRRGGQRTHITDVEATSVAVAPTQL